MEIQTLNPATPRQRQRIEAFLKRNGLRIDDMNYYAAMLDDDGEMIAGGGLKDDVIKCVAVDDAHKGEAIANTLVSHLISHANQEGYGCIKLFTKPKKPTTLRESVVQAPRRSARSNTHGDRHRRNQQYGRGSEKDKRGIRKV